MNIPSRTRYLHFFLFFWRKKMHLKKKFIIQRKILIQSSLPVFDLMQTHSLSSKTLGNSHQNFYFLVWTLFFYVSHTLYYKHMSYLQYALQFISFRQSESQSQTFIWQTLNNKHYNKKSRNNIVCVVQRNIAIP